MRFHSRALLVSFGLWLAGVSCLSAQTVSSATYSNVPNKLDWQTRQEAGAVLTGNQEIAVAVAARLRESGLLKGYKIDIHFQNGRLVLTGYVADADVRTEVARLAGTVAGVVSVVNQLAVGQPGEVVQTQVLQPPPIEGPPVEFEKKNGEKLPPFPPTMPGVPPVAPGTPPEPTPIFQAHPPGAGPHAHGPPPMPPYAWPTYAPYNNFSRVAYPTAYPHQAFPFIGPMYPFPKVPLGWRSVSLTWQDGFWWYGRNATGYHWWQTRFW